MSSATAPTPADLAAVACLRAALGEARWAGDGRSPFAIIATCLGELGVKLPPERVDSVDLRRARAMWLRRLRGSNRSESTMTAYRIALDDLIAWLERRRPLTGELDEATIVSYLDDYRERVSPAPATYYRRFVLLRRFFEWLAAQEGQRNPFVDLDAPPKPRQEAGWLTPDEFERMLKAAATPERHYDGIAERDRLVLLALVVTGLRRSELIALDWRDLTLEGERPSLLVRAGKGGRPRRQPLAPSLAAQLAALRERQRPTARDPVFRGLRGARLQPTILAGIIRRAARRAGIEKRVTAHTLRHTAATWLRHETGDARLVAEYLGHADLSTVHRYTHVADEELDRAAELITSQAGIATRS
jgi:site-specific recombinase XerD